MSEKRRSLLFNPFHLGSGSKNFTGSKSTSNNTKEGKFEVVNRKKSPLQMSSAPAVAIDSLAAKSTTNSRPLDTAKPPSRTTKKEIQHETRSVSDTTHNPSVLNVDVVHIPPVPDYNSIRLDAPPVTIQGRTVSMTSGQGRTMFKRKPPIAFDPVSESKGDFLKQVPLEPISAEVENVANIETFDDNDNDETNDTNDDYSFSDSGHDDSTNIDIPGSFIQPVIRPSLSLSAVDSGSNSSFYDAKDLGSREVFGSQISFIKPLKIHQKTPSTATIPTDNGDGDQTGGGHKKKLSLSDELLRDIQNFEPEFQSNGEITDHGETTDDDRIYSPVDTPVSPLRSHSRDTSQVEPTLTNLSILDPHEEEIQESATSEIGNEHSSPQHESTALFKDSSESESDVDLPKSKDFLIDPVFHSTNPKDRLVSNSSVAVQVDYNDPIEQDEISEQIKTDGLVMSDSLRNVFTELEANDTFEDNQLNQNFNFPNQSTGLHIVNNDISDEELYETRTPLHVANNTDDDSDSFKYNYDPQKGIETGTQEPNTTFHVVNDGNYSDSSSDQNSFSLRNREEDIFHKDETYINQQQENVQKFPDFQDSESDILSFTAKSPNDSNFNFDSGSSSINPHPSSSNYSVSDIQLNSERQPVLTQQPQHSTVPVVGVVTAALGASAVAASLTSNYDRRNEPVAPVQYMSTMNKTRRPPPDHESTIATRVARSTSVTVNVPNVYNSIIREDDIEDTSSTVATTGGPTNNVLADSTENQTDLNKEPAYSPATHKPLTSSYVESIRFGSKVSNSSVSASKWGLPVGISQLDYSKGGAASNAQVYRKLRSTKVDLKHGKIKARLLASEVDDDEGSTSSLNVNKTSNTGRNSFDETGISITTSSSSTKQSPDHLDNTTQYSSSIFNPSTQSQLSTSPKITDNPSSSSTVNVTASSHTSSGVQRSGTLMTHDVSPVLQMGRHGSVRQSGAGMTLYIANPDNSDSD